MNFWIIFFIIIGAFIGICPTIIARNVTKCSSEDLFESKKAESKVNSWLLFFSWFILIASGGFTTKIGIDTDKEITELKEKVTEANTMLEFLTTDVVKDTLFIREYLPKNEEE